MAKSKTQFLCNSCGSVHPKWLGKCPDCGAWDALQEFAAPTPDARKPTGGGAQAQADALHGARPLTLTEIDSADIARLPTGITEFDRILGGGVVPGSAVLVGGQPGIGKSTLLLQVAHQLAAAKPDQPAAKVLYVTSEESAQQVAMRAGRLGATQSTTTSRTGSIAPSGLLVLAETNLERILHQINAAAPQVVIVDSVQMIYKPNLPAAPGSVTQLRDCCMDLVYLAKASGIAVIVVGHVTKAGTLAGPKIIEHIVDTVVYFEGDRFHAHRIVRCVKNRFGSTHEVGLFEMTGQGLAEVRDPGKLFVEQYGLDANGRPMQPSGSVLTIATQGSRQLLLEVQALTASSVIGAAKRKTSGVSADRVAMIMAVLEKRAELRRAADDVIVNIAGGVKVIEPAIDLAIALAIASAYLNRPLPPGTLAVGELGLGGEVRSVPQLENRLREAARLGVTHAIVPHIGGAIPRLGGMALREVRRLSQAMAEF
jgi:DNA repair protein RadA/Sms